jgi:hypothetical protein
MTGRCYPGGKVWAILSRAVMTWAVVSGRKYQGGNVTGGKDVSRCCCMLHFTTLCIKFLLLFNF